MKHVYEDLYNNTDYGSAELGNCPTVYFFDDFKSWLRGDIIELGCGNGDGVQFIHEAGYVINGIDQVDLNNDMIVGDITQPLDLSAYNTSICIDVFEHVPDEGITGILKNMAQTKRQVITIHNKKAGFKGADGEQLHINIKPFNEWSKIIAEHLRICTSYDLSEYLRIYYCES